MKITPWARSFLNDFWVRHPDRRLECHKKYGFDPIIHETQYWIKGIKEKAHKMTLQKIVLNNDVFNLALAVEWASQELKQK
jgi:hypothetical protein